MAPGGTVDAVSEPMWWLHRLVGELLLDQPRMALMDRYYRGDHPLPDIPQELTADYRRMLALSCSNFCGVVVDAPAERLNLQGFRVRGQEKADADAWAWWIENGMDVDANLAIVNALSMGRGYVSLSPPKDGETEPSIHIEDPRMAMVDFAPSDRQKRVAGLRLYYDDYHRRVFAELWFADRCFYYSSATPQLPRSELWPQSWQPPFPINSPDVARTTLTLRESDAKSIDAWQNSWEFEREEPNPFGEVPIVPIVNRPSSLKTPDGESEIEDVYLTQERINGMLFNRALAAWTAAYQQKWATGIDIPIDPDGKPVQTFQAAVDRIFADTNPEAKFGAFPATDLGNYVGAIEEDVQHIAVQTRTPRHYFLQQGQSPSGDAIKSAEAGLVAKVLERQKQYGRSFAELVRLRQAFKGEESKAIETIWSDPEFRTLGELTDAVIKQVQAGILPIKVAREKLNNSPSEIERMERLDAQAALVADAQQMSQPPTPGQPAQTPQSGQEQPTEGEEPEAA